MIGGPRFLHTLCALCCAVVLAGIPAARAATSVTGVAATEQLSELLRVHDLGTSVAVGNRYLKQQCLVAVRGVLERLGSERHLGPEWKRGNPFWDRAEAAMLEPLHARMQAEWASLQWLTPEWVQMGSESFSAEDLAELLRHFRTAIGEKQAKIIDHSIAFHVAGYYGMSGKLIQDYPGTEAEQKALTYAWDDEDRAMRFSIESSNNIEGQRFALSPLGAKYQKTLIIKLTGILNARIDELARGLPGEAASETALADPFLTDFRAANDR